MSVFVNIDSRRIGCAVRRRQAAKAFGMKVLPSSIVLPDDVIG
jgi:hypothetical protein